MPLPTLPESITGGQTGHLAHHADIHARLNAMANIEVYDRVVTSPLESTDATTWVSIDEFDVTTAASGQRWIMSYNIIYSATAAAGIIIRFKINSTSVPGITTADFTVTGAWSGPTLAAPTVANSDYSQVETVRYRAGVSSNGRSFGGHGANVDTNLRGEFRIEVNGTNLADRILGVEFRQNTLDATSSTKLLQGSYAVLSRTV